jgi:tyrosyl-tRNA synthetase
MTDRRRAGAGALRPAPLGMFAMDLDMQDVKSDFLRVMMERGFFHQCSDLEGLDEKLTSGIVPAYIGFDCTAKSFHIGNLVQIMRLYWLQQTGHRPLVLMGGGTTRVGDPSGKDEMRKMLTPEQIAENMESLKSTFARFVQFGEGPRDALMVNNDEWLAGLNYIDMLREVGRHFSVNRMLTMDTVRTRLDREQELSFLEFNYMVLQAYDFVMLARNYDCILQMGGSDQWGNIIMGVDLGRRLGTQQLYALTSPLITKADGSKMGKTAAGAVWLNADMLSPYDYWQFWRNTADADVGKFLKLFTTLPLDEIARLEALEGVELNEAKKVLATEATALVHGREAAEASQETARVTFEEGRTAATLPSVSVARARLDDGLGVLDAFVEAGLVSSTSEARRQIKGGGLRVNDARLEDVSAALTARDLNEDGAIKLSLGRKKHVLLRPS